ncbi:MAG TPA: EAL domain-containing protein, partial [Cellvibrio sp.]|nr:EAL domain-containing protein [Cellvibrio sp.]
VVQDINRLGDVIAATNPLAVVCDLIFPEGNLAGVEYFKSITENRLPPLPAIFISSNQDFDARLACARAGGSHFFSKPLDKVSLVRSLRELVGLKNNDPYRILLVDDDENLLQLYGETLELAGYKVFRAPSAREGLDFLINEDPEMILLDIHLEDCNGLELGKVIRQHERFAYTPLMFMSSDTRTDVQLAAVRLAGDDFISKPIEPWRLLMTVEPRVKRSRLMRNPSLSHGGMANKGDVYDPLTALPNLRYLRSIVDEKLAPEHEKVQLCLVKIDIDDFHHVNDVYGHYQADRMLQQIAWEISHCLHFEDILSRESGDEFYVLLVSPVSVINQKTIIKNIANAIAKIKVSYNDNLRLSISVGVALAPQDSRNAVDLIAHTDTALFHAKTQANDRVCYFDACVQETLLHQFKLENDVRHIMERNQLLAYYQPIFNVADMRLTGFEALVRWLHPQRGIVAPDQFMYAVEKQGLMPQLTEWMLDHAMQQQAIWQLQGHNPIMHVNITATDVQNAHFVDLVQSLLLKHSINPAQLMLELTESTLMKNWDMGGKLLRSLRELGVKLAIDDFGTGYSSLSYLNRFPVDKLKIDRSFLNDWSVQKDERLISAIISLSKAMGFGVVAEGVEERQQLDFLKNLGCDEFQGYFISKPLAANEIANAVWFNAI